MQQLLATTLDVRAPARLHFGLFNESAIDHQIDGGAGVAIEKPAWHLRIDDPRNHHKSIDSKVNPKVHKTFHRLLEAFGHPPLHLEVVEGVPFHIGLGSNTSLSMAIGYALAHISNERLSATEIATKVGRGGTSGVGVHIAQHAGFVIDAGHQYPHEKAQFGPSSDSLAPPPPLRAAYMPPPEWRVLHLNLGHTGLHGAAETNFFRKHCPVPVDQTKAINALVASTLIPSLQSGDLVQMHAFQDELQNLGLKAAEWSIQHSNIQSLRASWTEKRRVDTFLAPLCLSSMGPTIFFVTDDPGREFRALRALGINQDSVTVTNIAKRGVRIGLS